MQTLWSRAAQAQSVCRCRICLHSTHAVTRRSTTAASKRRFTFADIFTACYGTILGTATFIDARHKNQRREQLDAELDRARAALNKLDVGPRQETVNGEAGAPLAAMSAETPSLSELSAFLQPWRGDESVRPLLEELKSLCNLKFRPLARQTWMQKQLDWVNLEAAVAAEEFNRSLRVQEPQTAASLADTTIAVLSLVDRLLQLTEVPKRRRWEGEAQTTCHAENIIAELDDLKRKLDYPSYQFPTADPDYAWHVRSCLNSSIRRVFHQAVTSRETVGRICYNLLTAGVPPSIHTYNTLIVGFNRMQRPDLAQVVVDSYLDKTTLSATDQTLICLLSHYQGPGGKEGFREAVQKMRGVREDGLHFATICNDSDAFNWTRTRRRGRPKANRTDVTFDHLIRGWIYHEELGIACMTFVACLRNGASLPVYTLCDLFKGCLAAADFSSARKLLTGIIDNFDNFQAYLSQIMDTNPTTLIQGLLRDLHQIINICWLPFGEIFGETEKKYAAAAESLKAMVSDLTAQVEGQGTPQFPSLLSDTANHLQPTLNPSNFATSRQYHTQLRRRTVTEFEELYSRIAMLVSIERRYGDLEERALNLGAALKAVIIEIKTGYSIDVEPIMPLNFIGTPIFEKQRFATRRALSLLDVSSDCLTIEDVASQLLRNIPDKAVIGPLEENENWKRLTIPTLISFFFGTADSTRSYEGPYEDLEEQLHAITESIKALIFSHLTEERQQRLLYSHGHYHTGGIRRLRASLRLDMKHNLPEVLQMSTEPHEAGWETALLQG
ncbi:hypothetical protein F5Y08DRAFT_305858 [Xylaria arbuscula]|nr:hypothetical protein F5Y08DRAFT_305858 [Xylaria arbuscula]